MADKHDDLTIYLIDEARKAHAIDVLSKVDTMEPWRMILTKTPEARRDVQNRLMWAWINQLAEQTGESPEYIHGWSKLTILIPLQLTWYTKEADEPKRRRLEFVREVIQMVDDHRKRCLIAYDMVRTKPPYVTVKQFADYLTAFEHRWEYQGFTLVSQTNDYRDALGMAA